MRKEDFAETFGDINEKHILEARADRKAKKPVWLKWAAMAACLCLVLCGTIVTNQFRNEVPNPGYVRVANPIMEVTSVEEMEQYLDFSVPVLEKDVDSYIVMVIDGYPQSARIKYADNSVFNMKFGSGDISGIYGGKLEKEETIGGIRVSFYAYENIRYATWEKDGFTFSLSGNEKLEADVTILAK